MFNILPDVSEKLTKADLKTAFVCHSKIFYKEVGGIMVVANNEVLDKIGLVNNHGKEPNFKLRMLSDKRNEVSPIYLFEFNAKFDDNIVVNAHLNPKEKAFRNFCVQCIKTGMMSLHFYNLTNQATTSIHMEVDQEDLDWFSRNLEVSKKIRLNPFFKNLSEYVKQQNSNDKTFYFFENKKIKFAGF